MAICWAVFVLGMGWAWQDINAHAQKLQPQQCPVWDNLPRDASYHAEQSLGFSVDLITDPQKQLVPALYLYTFDHCFCHVLCLLTLPLDSGRAQHPIVILLCTPGSPAHTSAQTHYHGEAAQVAASRFVSQRRPSVTHQLL